MSKKSDQEINNPFKSFPGYLLIAISQRFLSKLSRDLKDVDIRASEATVLIFIKENPGILQSQIGTKANIASANMAPLINNLIKKELVRRKAIDGRSFGLFLTSRGKKRAEKVLKIMEAHEEYIGETIPEKHRDIFLKCLITAYLETSPDNGQSAA